MIRCIVPLTKGRDGTIKRFSTSGLYNIYIAEPPPIASSSLFEPVLTFLAKWFTGLDGKIVVWDLENHMTIAK